MVGLGLGVYMLTAVVASSSPMEYIVTASQAAVPAGGAIVSPQHAPLLQIILTEHI